MISSSARPRSGGKLGRRRREDLVARVRAARRSRLGAPAARHCSSVPALAEPGAPQLADVRSRVRVEEVVAAVTHAGDDVHGELVLVHRHAAQAAA